MTDPKIGDWVLVTRRDPGDHDPYGGIFHGPTVGRLEAVSAQNPPEPRYCVSWPEDPRGIGHWWVPGVRLATPEEVASAQLASLETGL